MKDIVVSGYAKWTGDVILHDDEESVYWAIVRTVVGQALDMAFPMPSRNRYPDGVGIAFLTETGERWPEKWAHITMADGRPRPRDYGHIVHNAAPGWCSISYGLTGPQIALLDGDIVYIAALQILTNAARAMVVCALEMNNTGAHALVLESRVPVEKRKSRFIPLDTVKGAGSYRGMSSLQLFQRTCEDIASMSMWS